MCKWISVKDKLPDHARPVLVLHVYPYKFVKDKVVQERVAVSTKIGSRTCRDEVNLVNGWTFYDEDYYEYHDCTLEGYPYWCEIPEYPEELKKYEVD